jgi:hypothetical protein
MKNKYLVLSATLFVAGLVGCASSSSVKQTDNQVQSTTSPQVQSAASVTDATFVTELTFQPGSSKLTSAAKSRINELIRDAKASGKIEDIKVLSWADQEYPSEQAGKLSQAQRNLAEARTKEIRNHISAADNDIDVDAYNMAERPGAISRLMGTENAKLKKRQSL